MPKTTTQPEAGTPFWRYSLAVYHQPLQQALLRFQDERGGCINTLLWCFWLDAANVSLSESQLQQALADLRLWRARVIEPLRALRRELKLDPQADGVRRQVQKAELSAEQHAQQRLFERAQQLFGELEQWPEAMPEAAVEVRAQALSQALDSLDAGALAAYANAERYLRQVLV